MGPVDATRSPGGRPAMDGTLGRPGMARTLAYFYLAGAALGLASLALPHTGTPTVAAAVLIGMAAFTGVLLLARGADLPQATIPGFLAAGTLLITAAVYLHGDPTSEYALLYVWVAVEAFYFLGLWPAVAQVVLLGATY